MTLPARLVKHVDWLAPLEDMTRDELILEAIKRILKPHLEIRKQGLRSALEVERGKVKTYGPFKTADEMIASMKAELGKRKITKAISDSTGRFKTRRYEK